MPDHPFVIFIMGPTATGKTDLAVFLHEKLDCDIISVDSAMVYRGMDIGTAKPDKALLKKVPHRLIDICDPAEVYSAARFHEDANRAIDDILAADRIPVLVGGTGLYFRALELGLARLPEADQEIRASISQAAEKTGWQAQHRRLEAVDPEAARKINANDPQRIQRALEVYELTGEPLSSLLSKGRSAPLKLPVKKIVLIPEDRAELHRRIEVRFLKMLEDGFVDEVDALHQRGDLSMDIPSMRMVGYRQIWRYLEGLSSYRDMQAQAINGTRQLAKRQITWCRGETGTNCHDPYKKDVYSKVWENLL